MAQTRTLPSSTRPRASLAEAQTHNNEDVYKKAVHILESYFGLDDDDTQLAPETTQQGFVFQGAAQPGPPPGSHLWLRRRRGRPWASSEATS